MLKCLLTTVTRLLSSLRGRRRRGGKGEKTPKLPHSFWPFPLPSTTCHAGYPMNDYSRFYPRADRREAAVDYSVHRLVDSLGRGAQANAERIRPLEALVRQTQYLIHRWEMFALKESCLCTSVLLVRALPAVLVSNSRVGRLAYDISIPQGNRMWF